MLITISSKDKGNISFEGTLSTVTNVHNANKVRTLAGALYTFNNGIYKTIKVNITQMNNSLKEKLEFILLGGKLDITTEVGDEYYSVAFVDSQIDYTNENEKMFSANLTFENNLLVENE